MPKECSDCLTLARALYACMKATGLSMHPKLIEAMGDDEKVEAGAAAWKALKDAGFLEEPEAGDEDADPVPG